MRFGALVALFTLPALLAQPACRSRSGSSRTARAGTSPGVDAGVEVAGPEASDLLAAAGGRLIVDDPPGGLVSYDLPGLTRHDLRRTVAEGTVPGGLALPRALGIPDARGQLPVVDALERSLRVSILDPAGGPARPVLERPLAPAPVEALGSSLALSPGGQRLAYLRDVEPEQHPAVKVARGTLEVLDLSGAGAPPPPRPTGIRPIDDNLAWLDDQRLVYVDLVDRASLPAPLQTEADRAFSPARWRRVPVVHVLDLGSQERRAIAIGRQPLVGHDPGTGGQGAAAPLLLAGGRDDGRWIGGRVGTDNQVTRRRPLAFPGLVQPLALAGTDLVLFRGAPTRGVTAVPAPGASSSFARRPSRHPGREAAAADLPLKLGRLSDGRVQTVLGPLGPSRLVRLTAARRP